MDLTRIWNAAPAIGNLLKMILIFQLLVVSATGMMTFTSDASVAFVTAVIILTPLIRLESQGKASKEKCHSCPGRIFRGTLQNKGGRRVYAFIRI